MRRKHLSNYLHLRKYRFHFSKLKYEFYFFLIKLNSVCQKPVVKVSWQYTSYCFFPCQRFVSLSSDRSLRLLCGTEMIGDNFVSGNQSREIKYWMHLCKVTQNLQTFTRPMDEHFLSGKDRSVFGKILFRMCNFSPGLNHHIGQDISAAFLTVFSHQAFVIQHRKI